jgi:enoyl-CoA hydratase/carnithine racemase
MAEACVLCSLDGGIAEITLNRPERLNAYNFEMAQELVRLFDELGKDDSVRVIIVTGAGRAFCAGADMAGGTKTFERRPAEGEGKEEAEAVPPGARLREVQPWKIPKPIIAAINGAAVGVGLTMPLQWDLRIAAEDAKLAFAFVQRGVITELSSTYILPRLIGVARASDLLLTGRTLLGKEAAELGLVNEALPRDEVLPRAREIAHYIVERCAPASVALTKRFIWEHLQADDPLEVAVREARALARLGRLPDAAEGVTAFIEKRKPSWKLGPSDAAEID